MNFKYKKTDRKSTGTNKKLYKIKLVFSKV